MGETSDSSDHRPQFSPLVRRLAQEHNIDPETLVGTGPGGRVTRTDVLREAFGEQDAPGEPGWAPVGPAPKPEAKPEPEAEAESAPVEVEDRPAPRPYSDRGTGIDGGPTFTVVVEVDASQLFRAQDRLAGQRNGPVDVDALLIRLVVPPLSEFPRLNATIESDTVEPSEQRNIGFIFEANGQSKTIVVGGAEELTLQDLDQAVVELKQRAEHDQLSINETGGQTFTICNLTGSGAMAAAAAVPVETTAILTYGAGREVVLMGDDGPQTATRLTVTGTFSDAALTMLEATRFLARVATYLEDPILAFAD